MKLPAVASAADVDLRPTRLNQPKAKPLHAMRKAFQSGGEESPGKTSQTSPAKAVNNPSDCCLPGRMPWKIPQPTMQNCTAVFSTSVPAAEGMST